MGKVLDIEILKGGAEMISFLSAEWNVLYGEGCCTGPFLTPEWFSALVTNFKKEVEIVTVRKEKKLRALLPLMRSRARLHGLPVRKLQAVFNPNTPQYDLVHGADTEDQTAILNAIWRDLEKSKGWDVFECRLVKADSWLIDLLPIAKKSGFMTGVWPMGAAPFIEVPSQQTDGSIDDFFVGPRRHFGKELNRRLKRLREKGTVEFAVTSEYSPEMLDRYLDLESKGWKGRGGTAAALDKRAAALHADFARALAANGDLLIYELRLNSLTIAMSINIKYSDRVYHWKTTYDEEFSRYSPGNLLFRKLLTDCAAAGTTEIDFMCPSLPYKKVWASGERDHVALYIFRPAFWGRLSWMWKFAVIGQLRKMRDVYPRLIASVGM